MKRIRFGVLFLLAIVMILQACSKHKAIEETPVSSPMVDIPLIKDTQTITVFDPDGKLIAEHREPDVINELLQGMKEARPSYIGDPEQSGDLYQLVLAGNDKSRTFSVNDLRKTNALDVSVKLYATISDEEQAKAWSLNTSWIQRLLDAQVNDEEPELLVTLDEDNDSATLVANRDIDQQSLREAIESTLIVRSSDDDASAEFTMNWTDSRRVVLRFPDLPQGATVEFRMEGTETHDGEPFQIRSPQDGKVLTLRQGSAWSGLRWVDTTGRTVHEHGFHSGVMIQPLRYREFDQEIVIYNNDNITYLFDPDKREIKDISIPEWADDKEEYRSDDGVDRLYSYSAEKDILYVAKGLQTIYRVNPADGTKQAIYESDRPIYGMASSPNGEHIAILLDSELNLGPYADLLVIDDKGKIVSEFTKAAYSGHSDGWHFIYPVRWVDDETIAVPLIGSSGESFFRGKALFYLKKGLLSKEATPATLPEDAVALLKSSIDELDPSEIMRVLPKPHDEHGRYYAAFVGGYGSYLIDRVDKRVTLIGSGALVTWTSAGQVVVWHSTEGKSVGFMDIE